MSDKDISDVKHIVTFGLFERFVKINKPYFDALEEYLRGEHDDALIQDLTKPSQVALEVGKHKRQIYRVIEEGHIKTYTDANLVRRSEVRRYLKHREMEKEAQKAKKASEA